MAVCSILYQLATRPEEQEKLHAEVRRILPDANTPLTIQTLDKMVYLKAFIKEVFRVYTTVIGNGRTMQHDTVICGYQVPKGIQVVFPTIVTGNMEEYVSDAATFKPERWLKASQGGTEGKLHPFASLPYGYGARMCLGRRFADLEMQMLLTKVSARRERIVISAAAVTNCARKLKGEWKFLCKFNLRCKSIEECARTAIIFLGVWCLFEVNRECNHGGWWGDMVKVISQRKWNRGAE